MNRVLPLVPNIISKGDKTVKVVNNYEQLASKAGDTSQKYTKSEFPSRGDSLKHKGSHNFDFKDKQGIIIDDSSPMKPVPPAPPLQKKNTALEVLQKKREEFQ